MKAFAISFLVVTAAGATLHFGPARSAPDSVAIKDACNTFVTGYKLTTPATATQSAAWLKVPALRTGRQGLELVISFTPAKNEEARSVFSAVSSGTRAVVVFPGKQIIKAVGIEDGYLVLAANSATHAKEILQLLCFESPNTSVNTDAPKAARPLP